MSLFDAFIVPCSHDSHPNSSLLRATQVKHYGCLCWSSKPHTSHELGAILDSTSSTTIIQSTPIRVLHRRAPMKRSREVLYRRTEWINNHFFRLWIATSAGAYVKEFVTGDFGRTNPSVSTMLDCQCDILQLDCVGIQMGT
jgi:tRNA pseudouridine synthase 10